MQLCMGWIIIVICRFNLLQINAPGYMGTEPRGSKFLHGVQKGKIKIVFSTTWNGNNIVFESKIRYPCKMEIIPCTNDEPKPIWIKV